MREGDRKGVACIVLSALGFAVMGAFVRLADETGAALPSIQKSFFRNAVAFLVALAALPRARGLSWGEGPRWRRAGVLLMRSVFGTLGILGNFYAISHLRLADALMMNKLAPFFTVLASWAFLGERMTARGAWCLLGALAGTALVVKPGTGEVALLPAALGIGGGVAAGAAYACVRELGLMKMDGRLIVLFFSGFSCLACVPFMACDFAPMNAAQVASLLGAGVSAAVGQFAVTAAYRFAEARKIAVYDYTNVLFAAMLGYAMFGQVPDALAWAGFAAITLSALAMRRVSG